MRLHGAFVVLARLIASTVRATIFRIPAYRNNMSFDSGAISREAYVFSKGTVNGAIHSLQDDPLAIASEAGVAALASAGLMLATRGKIGGAIAPVLGAVGVAALTKDVFNPQRIQTISDVWAKTWEGDTDLDAQAQRLEQPLGRFAVDMTAMFAGGAIGGKLAGGRLLPAKENLETKTVSLQPGEETTIPIKVDGRWREYQLRLPPSYAPDGKAPLVVAFDGTTLINHRNALLTINGLGAYTDARGAVAVAAIPESRFGGLITSWNNPKVRMFSTRSGYDDVNYVRSVLADVRARLPGIGDDLYLTGFSGGGQLANHLAGELDGVRSVAGISSTAMGFESPPRPGVNGMFVHGAKDATIPYEGGMGSGPLRWLKPLVRHNLELSQPWTQAPLYARQNGFSGEPVVRVTPHYTETIYPSSQTATGAEVRNVLLNDGGHSWPGRATGGANETAVSKGNGLVVGADVFNANKEIVDFFGLPEVAFTGAPTRPLSTIVQAPLPVARSARFATAGAYAPASIFRDISDR